MSTKKTAATERVFVLQTLGSFFDADESTSAPNCDLHPRVSLPAQWSLQEHVKEIYYQARLGACMAFAIKGILKALKPDFEYSALYLYQVALQRSAGSRSKQGNNRPLSDIGSSALVGLEVLASEGVCEEHLLPYTLDERAFPTNFGKEIPQAAHLNARSHRFPTHSDVTRHNSDPLITIQQCITDGYFVLMAFVVYSSFMSEEVIRTGIMPMPTDDDVLRGAHQVYICAYDSTHVTCVNSWSDAWGMRGYFRMPVQYLNHWCSYKGMRKRCVQQLAIMDRVPNHAAPQIPRSLSDCDFAQLIRKMDGLISDMVTIKQKLALLSRKQAAKKRKDPPRDPPSP